MLSFDTIEDMVLAVTFAVSTSGVAELIRWVWALF
jgi:hypothetical protein